MKKLILFLIINFILLIRISFSQTILNPSFENVNSPPCAYNLSNSAFNAVILNVTAFGTYGDCDIINSTCPYGTAHQGDWFIGLSVNNVAPLLYDAIAVKLSSPLIAGFTYQFSFYQKKDTGYSSNPLEIGYSVNGSTQGTVVTTVSPVSSTSWVQNVVYITPNYNTSYITIAAQPVAYGWNHLDDLQLTNVTSIYNLFSTDGSFSIFPDPFQNEITISLPVNYGYKLPADLKIFDVYGKEVLSQHINETNTRFQTSNFPPGNYFLKVTSNGNTIIKRIVKI